MTRRRKEAHREAQQRHVERLRAMGAPTSLDIARAITTAMRNEIGRQLGENGDYHSVMKWLVVKARDVLVQRGFSEREASRRLWRTLKPQDITLIDGIAKAVSGNGAAGRETGLNDVDESAGVIEM